MQATAVLSATAQIAAAQSSSGMPPLEKVVVAIHGIGSQQRSDTIRSVARRFGARSEPPLPMMPLGFFHGEAKKVQLSRLDTAPDDERAKIADGKPT